MRGKIDIDGGIRHTPPLEPIHDAFEPMRAGTSIRTVITY